MVGDLQQSPDRASSHLLLYNWIMLTIIRAWKAFLTFTRVLRPCFNLHKYFRYKKALSNQPRRSRPRGYQKCKHLGHYVIKTIWMCRPHTFSLARNNFDQAHLVPDLNTLIDRRCTTPSNTGVRFCLRRGVESPSRTF